MLVADLKLQIVALAVVAAILLQSGSAACQAPATQIVDDPDAYAVYAAVLATGWPKPGIARGEIALVEKTTTHELCAGWEESLPAEWRAPVQDQIRQDAVARRLLPGFDLQVPYALITSEKYEDLIMTAAGDVKNVYADFWGGMSVAFSAVGFDAAKTRAMVTLQYSCPSGCGGGRHFLLEKQAGHWDLTKANIPTCTWPQ